MAEEQNIQNEDVRSPEILQDDNIFTRYAKSNGDRKILLMYLLLNKFDVSKIKNLEELYEDKEYDLKLRKLYGITEEFVDIKQIEEEIKAIKNPRIVDVESFEYYSGEPLIYKYSAKYEDRRLYINDLGILSDVMVIAGDCVISENRARPVTESGNRGFMYFYDYVLYSNMTINKWHVTYYNKVFSIYYITKNHIKETGEEVEVEEVMYQAVNVDKAYTYKMVIYIIQKNSDDIEENLADNFIEESYELLEDK